MPSGKSGARTLVDPSSENKHPDLVKVISGQQYCGSLREHRSKEYARTAAYAVT